MCLLSSRPGLKIRLESGSRLFRMTREANLSAISGMICVQNTVYSGGTQHRTAHSKMELLSAETGPFLRELVQHLLSLACLTPSGESVWPLFCMFGIVCPLLRLIRGLPPIRHGLGPCQTSPIFVCGAAELSFTYSAINELNWTLICSQLCLLAIQMVTRAGSSGIQSQSALLSLKELNSMSSLSPYPNSLLLHLLLSLLTLIVSHCHWKQGGMFLLWLQLFQ